ncbi:hypothetical protein COXBURSA331_A0030 [Coxiella burnetii RSA 331]|nr:hypothetical protein COXBURSA331_A0030 [Coxiella burnetii RSA 331]EDR36674.1 hypothetical protein COXBURSA334_2220 [Coxiella burnetii Q321]
MARFFPFFGAKSQKWAIGRSFMSDWTVIDGRLDGPIFKS